MRATVLLALLALLALLGIILVFQKTPALTQSAGANAWMLHTIDKKFSGADGIDLFDLDEDGDLDAVVSWEEDGRIMFYKNPGPKDARHRWPRTDISGGLDTKKIEDARFADFDGDGHVDAVVSATETHNKKVGIHWLTDRQEFTKKESWTGTWIDRNLHYLFLKLAIGQIDNRGANDIVVGTKTKHGVPGKLIWYPAPDRPDLANSGKWRGLVIAGIGWIRNIDIMDMDNDGDNDILMSDNKRLSWFENRLREKPMAPWREEVISYIDNGYFRVCGLEGDGRLRIVAGGPTYDRDNADLAARIYSQDGTDGRWVSTEVRTTNRLPRDNPESEFVIKGIACGDLNNDGLMDLTFSMSGFGYGVFALIQDIDSHGVTEWKTTIVSDVDHNHLLSGIKYDTVELADLDEDGDLDVITTEENGGTLLSGARGLGVVWYENPNL